MGTSRSVTLVTFLMPPKEIATVAMIRTTKAIQYSAELVGMAWPVTVYAIWPTAEIVLKPCAGKHSSA